MVLRGFCDSGNCLLLGLVDVDARGDVDFQHPRKMLAPPWAGIEPEAVSGLPVAFTVGFLWFSAAS